EGERRMPRRRPPHALSDAPSRRAPGGLELRKEALDLARVKRSLPLWRVHGVKDRVRLVAIPLKEGPGQRLPSSPGHTHGARFRVARYIDIVPAPGTRLALRAGGDIPWFFRLDLALG